MTMYTTHAHFRAMWWLWIRPRPLVGQLALSLFDPAEQRHWRSLRDAPHTPSSRRAWRRA